MWKDLNTGRMFRRLPEITHGDIKSHTPMTTFGREVVFEHGFAEVVWGDVMSEVWYVASDQTEELDGMFWRISQVYKNRFSVADAKAQRAQEFKALAGRKLAQSDWVVIRKIERGIEIPADVVALRQAIIDFCTWAEVTVQAKTKYADVVTFQPGAWPDDQDGHAA